MDLVSAVASGDRTSALKALADVLATSILAATEDKRAPLAARLTDVLEQIEKLTPAEKAGDPIDEIAARRSARGGATARLGQAKRGTS